MRSQFVAPGALTNHRWRKCADLPFVSWTENHRFCFCFCFSSLASSKPCRGRTIRNGLGMWFGLSNWLVRKAQLHTLQQVEHRSPNSLAQENWHMVPWCPKLTSVMIRFQVIQLWPMACQLSNITLYNIVYMFTTMEARWGQSAMEAANILASFWRRKATGKVGLSWTILQEIWQLPTFPNCLISSKSGHWMILVKRQCWSKTWHPYVTTHCRHSAIHIVVLHSFQERSRESDSTVQYAVHQSISYVYIYIYIYGILWLHAFLLPWVMFMFMKQCLQVLPTLVECNTSIPKKGFHNTAAGDPIFDTYLYISDVYFDTLQAHGPLLIVWICMVRPSWTTSLWNKNT